MSGSYLEVFPNVTTTYTVTGDVNGCTGTGLAVVNVYPYPEVTFAADITEGCEGMLVQFTFLSDSSDVYNWYWTFGDYYFDTIQNPQHIYEEVGVYDVTLTISTVYGCTSSLTVPEMITVHPNPYAEFTYTPDKTTILDPLFWFYEQCNGASIWNWNFGDTDPLTNISNYPNPTHMYSDTGKYLVTLVAISDFGCTDTARHIVEVDPDVMIYVPNAFTPNNDGKNSIFISKGDGIDLSTFEMRIYDRWGKQMLYTNDIELGWDGNYNGKPAPQGIYTWYISFSDVNNKEHILKGIVTLVR
jgi:gliding motility-associated-like protein